MQRRYPRLGGLDHVCVNHVYMRCVTGYVVYRNSFDSTASESVREYVMESGQNTGKLHRGTNHCEGCQVHCHCAKMNSARITGSNTTVIARPLIPDLAAAKEIIYFEECYSLWFTTASVTLDRLGSGEVIILTEENFQQALLM